MAKSKDGKGSEHYKAIIRKQRSVIKDLQKKASRGQKIKEQLGDLEAELVEQMLEEELQETSLKNDDRCPECGKGFVEVVDLKVRKLEICNKCNYRRVKK